MDENAHGQGHPDEGIWKMGAAWAETGYRADAITALLAFARDAESRWRFK
jgi:hypothetical protein